MENNPSNSTGTNIVIGIVIVVALALVGYGFYRSQNGGKINLSPSPNASTTPVQEIPAEIVNAKHQYKGGSHTYVGEFELPTPCSNLIYDVVKDPLNPQEIALEFTTTQDTDKVCAQVITPKTFKVTFTGPEKINLTVTHDGKSVKFNLFEVPASENIDTYQIEIKG